MTGLAASLGPLRISSASLVVINSSERSTWIFSSTAAGLRRRSAARYSRIFLRMNMAFVQM